MRRNFAIFAVALSAALILSFAHGHVLAQTSFAPSRITAAIDDSKLTVLRGNTSPLLSAAQDRGQAADSLQMDQMLLVLKRSPEQDAALDQLLAQQQDKNSPNYHRWLTPEEFGQRFGASDEDIQKITAWLESRGFRVNEVAKGRNLVNFSGMAGQVRTAFHTSMHQYMLNDRQHLSNSGDPAIPAALSSVVAGVASLNNFFPHAQHRAATAARTISSATHPNLTMVDGNSNTFFAIGPTDFATIYNIAPLYSQGIDGTGQTIAIVSASDINLNDVTQFRTIFGLPAIKFQRIIPSGSTNPGVVGPNANPLGGPDGDEDETEAVFDVEWSGAVAKNATIDLVISADGTVLPGIDLSAQFVVNNLNTMTPRPSVLSESYGQCELFLGSHNAFYNAMWSQAATEGLTVSVSTGDNGSDACDVAPSSGTGPKAGTHGLGVNGIASTPFNIAVGGTDFNNHVLANDSTFWNTTPGTLNSAKGYVPETTWNDSCTNVLTNTTGGPGIAAAFGDTTAAQACNDTILQNAGNNPNPNPPNPPFYFVAPSGGSGGASTCTNGPPVGGTTTSQCSGGYTKPTWQIGKPGVPSDGQRDIPDVSFFAEGAGDSLGLEASGRGNIPGSFYFACEMDQFSQSPACSTNGTFILGGGTSISAQVFAGVVALLDQSAGGPQGNLNPTFYSLAANQSAVNCNASLLPLPASLSTCIFNDVTQGTIAMPCLNTNDGTADCSTAGGGPIGVLTGYSAGTNYDLATGLGSINVANLAANLPSLGITASPSTVTISSPGQSGTSTLTFTGKNGFIGTMGTFACSGLPKGAACAFTQNGSAVSSVTVNGTNTTASVTLTVSTTAASAAPGGLRNGPNRWLMLELISLASALLAATWFAGARRNQRRLAPIFAVAAFALVFAMAGCSGNASNSGSGGGTGASSATPAGTSTVTVTSTNSGSGGTTSATFTLTVQ